MASVDTSPVAQKPEVPGWRALGPALAPPLLLVLGMAVATHSVVRYKLWIVVVYTVLAVLLAVWLLRGGRRVPGRAGSPNGAGLNGAGGTTVLVWTLSGALTLAAVIQLRVRPYTYLTAHNGWLVRWVYAVSAVLVVLALLAAAFTERRRLADLGLGVAMAGYVIAAVLLIHLDPAPKIDVWVMLQQTADGLLHGKDMYTQNWSGSPGVQNAFTYLPMMGVLLAPGRWLAGDVRWTLVVVTLLGVIAVRLLALPTRDDATTAAGSASDPAAPARNRRNTLAAVGFAALLLLLPGTATQVEQAWTEPLLMTCLAGWALGVQRRNTVLAVVCLALGVASKQHLVLLLPVLAAWPRFGLRKAVMTGGLAFVLVLPWIIASPKDIWHDAVTVLINFQPLIFADTLYIAAINNLSWTPPFWLTGAAVLGTLGAAAVQVRRRDPDLGTVLRWSALFLFVANLVNKQAFYNQYWLVAALVLISLAVPQDQLSPGRPDPGGNQMHATSDDEASAGTGTGAGAGAGAQRS